MGDTDVLRILWKRFLLLVGNRVRGVWLLRAHRAGHVCELFLWFKLRTMGPHGLELFKNVSVSGKWTKVLGL